MKLLKYFLIFIFFVLVGFGGLYTYLSSKPQIKIVNLKEIFKGSKFSLLEAPSLSLRGNITNLSGEVLWKGRIANDFERVLSSNYSIQQGESLKTGADGNLVLGYENVAKISMNKNSNIDIVQTIPNNLVLQQLEGEIKFQKLGLVPVSIRVKRLLVDILDQTEIEIDGDLVMITGQAKIAYNNNQNITKVLEVPIDKTLIFNNQTLKVVAK